MLPLQERISEALRLRAEGLSWAAVADCLGMQPDSVRKYARAHPCADGCGAWVASNRASRCHSCASPHHTPWGRAFTRQEIIAAIKLWANLEGTAPALEDWRTPGHPRWRAECPTFPPCTHVINEFGAWNKALNAAGFDRPRPRAWTRGQMIDEILAVHREHGETPSSGTWDRSPDHNIISRRCGTWNQAMEAAGLIPRFPAHNLLAQLSEAEILAEVRRMAMELGGAPRSSERVSRLKGAYHFPSGILVRLGCTWNEVLRRAGLPIQQRAATSREAVGEALSVFYREHGCWPTARQWSSLRLRPSTRPIYRLFNGWDAALAYAQAMLDDGRQDLAT